MVGLYHYPQILVRKYMKADFRGGLTQLKSPKKLVPILVPIYYTTGYLLVSLGINAHSHYQAFAQSTRHPEHLKRDLLCQLS